MDSSAQQMEGLRADLLKYQQRADKLKTRLYSKIKEAEELEKQMKGLKQKHKIEIEAAKAEVALEVKKQLSLAQRNTA